MKAIRFNATVPRYLIAKGPGQIIKALNYKGPLAPIFMDDVPEPELINENWVKIKTIYGGVCGSDIGMIFLEDTPFGEPYVTMPYTVGHENVGVIVEAGPGVKDFAVGDRVVADPMLPCAARDIDPPCGPCQRGDTSECLNMREGTLPQGFNLGFCTPVGGSWSEYFVAHHSQLMKVPDEMTDEQAIMLDILSSSLHAVMRNLPEPGQTVFVYGCGIVGMMATASLKALSDCRVIVIARYPHQAEIARGFGADEVIMQKQVDDLYAEIARLTDAQVLKPMIGPRFLNGGPDLVFDCVGHRETIDDAIRVTRAGGRIVIIGGLTVPRGIDWTPVWWKELAVKGTFCSSTETYQGKTQKTYAWAAELITSGKVKVDHLLTHIWKLDEYIQMIETATSKGDTGSIKQAFKL